MEPEQILDDLGLLLELGHDYGLVSIKQLHMFIMIARNNGKTLPEMSGLSSSHLKYPALRTPIRRLGFDEDPRRGVGLMLIETRISPQQLGQKRPSELHLTEKGKELWQLMIKTISL